MLAVIAAGLTIAGSASAAEPVSVWYRSAEGCPGVEAFLGRLATHAVTAVPARVGGRVDFVVTLGKDEHGSSGTLERQSAQGTIAIREVHAESCDAVADALVLTLALTVDPDAPSAAGAEPATPAPSPSSTGPTEQAPPINATEPRAPDTPPPPPDGTASTRADSMLASPWRASVGAQGFIGSFIGARPLYGANVSAGVRYERGIRPSARAGFVAGFSKDTSANLDARLLLGRLEACPASLGRVLSFEGCAALDLGSLRAENTAPDGKADHAFWASAWALGRAGYALSRVWSLELQAGLAVPLTHYDLSAGVPPRVVADTNRIGFGLGAGARITLP